jgi:hypothetical protein
MATRDELLSALVARYREAQRAEKGRILTEFAAVAGYHRKHAARLLRGAARSDRSRPRPERRLYDEAVREALIVLWEASDRLCGKRLKPLIPTLVAAMERHGRLALDPGVWARLEAISAATIDRVLKPVRQQAGGRGRRRTAPASAIRRAVPIRTYADWDDPPPGFFEADLVSHSGPLTSGSYAQTLVLTDISSGWTECAPLLFREQQLLSEVLTVLRAVTPLPILGLDADNDRVFINETVAAWCAASGVSFTRSRPYRKNDQAHIEQKNGAIVRRPSGPRLARNSPAGLFRPGKPGPLRKGRLSPLRGPRRDRRPRPSLQTHALVRELLPAVVQARGEDARRRPGPQAVSCAADPASAPRRDPRTPQAVRDALDAQHATLDPVRLLRDIRAAQQALIEIADTAPAATAGAPKLDAFVESLKVAWRSTEEVRPTAQPKPSKPRYRTVPDPLEAVTADLKQWFDADPGITGRQLLERVQDAHPGAYPDNLARTVQRRLKAWRRERARSLVLQAAEPDGVSGGPCGEALRWLRAPRLAARPPAPTGPLATAGAVAGSSHRPRGTLLMRRQALLSGTHRPEATRRTGWLSLIRSASRRSAVATSVARRCGGDSSRRCCAVMSMPSVAIASKAAGGTAVRRPRSTPRARTTSSRSRRACTQRAPGVAGNCRSQARRESPSWPGAASNSVSSAAVCSAVRSPASARHVTRAAAARARWTTSSITRGCGSRMRRRRSSARRR